MINIDPYLAAIDNNRLLQEKLELLAIDVFNNNEYLFFMHPEENALYSELVRLLEKTVKQHKDVFLDKNARSASSRFDYRHLYTISESDDEEYFIYRLTSNLVACLASEKQKNNEDYIEQLLTGNASLLPPNFDTTVSREGLVNVSGSSNQLKILDHAIDLLDGRRIYLHQFLRRHFNSNFVDAPRILNFTIRQGLKVEVRIDPFRIGDMSRYHDIIECDAWFGPKFNQLLLDSKDRSEKVTMHHFNGVDPREKMYNQYITIFRTSMLDCSKRLRQFFIEEYPPYLNCWQSSMPGVYEKYVIQRFSHFVYNQNDKNFDHIDCAIRIFSREEYDKFYEIANQGNDPGGRIGKRFKLFKISGGVSGDIIKRSLYSFFRYNIHLQEYFQNISFGEADKLSHSGRT